MICPEFRPLWNGIELADSLVFNPHKWLGVQFDCAAHFLRDPSDLVRTLAIRPEYLKTHGADGIINYSEWSIPLGRRFRALKLWFVIRHYGVAGLQAHVREHVQLGQRFAGWVAAGLARRWASVGSVSPSAAAAARAASTEAGMSSAL